MYGETKKTKTVLGLLILFLAGGVTFAYVNANGSELSLTAQKWYDHQLDRPAWANGAECNYYGKEPYKMIFCHYTRN